MNELVPLKPAAGVYVAMPPLRVTVPLAGELFAVTVSASLSASVSFASRLNVTASGAVVVAESARATGGVLGAATTVTVTRAAVDQAFVLSLSL